ncbi:MAG TPA: PLP-dependent lyase/thiolase [Candidatus Absconditabacterales bacterium]|nr:PLP-dependent lyase/thiolase [Candidatus Absconditabacterales bacterium]
MSTLQLKCFKNDNVYPFEINTFNDPSNSSYYSNLIVEGGYKVPGFRSLVPFKQLHITFGAQNTPLIENQKLSAIMGLERMFIKDESFNPYGTHKDRRSEFIVNYAIENDIDKIVCLTAGNAGYSLSRYCSRAQIDYTSLVFPWVSKERKKSLSEWANVLTIDGSKYRGILRPRDGKQIIEEFDKFERRLLWKNIWAVTNSWEPLSMNAYKELFYEVKDQKPDYIVLPCGSGDIIVGVWLAIKELGMDTKIIGVGPKDEHPLKYALEYGVEEFEITQSNGSKFSEEFEIKYKEPTLAEKLSSTFSGVLPILYHIFNEPGNIYVEVDNEEIGKTKKLLEDFGIKCEHSASVAFAAFFSHQRPDIDPSSKVIIISTGKGLEN